MPARFLIFFSLVTLVVLSAHGYVGWRLISSSTLTTTPRVLAWCVVFGFALLAPAAFTARFLARPPVADLAAWVGFSAMGIFSFVFTLTVLRDAAWLAMHLTDTFPTDPQRRLALLQTSNVALLGLAGGLSALGVFSARSRATVVDVRVPIAGLPSALEGFTIAQISDIHVGPTIKRGFIDGIVDAVNQLNADVIAVTGDLVDGSVADLAEHTAPLGRLSARHGVFFVTGNHEYYSGAEEWVSEVRRLGLRALLNEHHVVEHEGERIIVAGVTDFNAGQMLAHHAHDPHKAIANAPEAAVRLLLAHQPRSAYVAADAGFHLQLSGHTHGGQMFPWNFFVRLQQPFNAGLNRMKDLWVYTSRGTGYWGPPMRVGAPSEISRITLTRA